MSQVRAVAVSRLMPSALASVKIFDRHDRYEWHLRRRIRWWIRCPVRRCPFSCAAGSKISGSLTGRKIPRLASSLAGVLKRLSKTTLVSSKKRLRCTWNRHVSEPTYKFSAIIRMPLNCLWNNHRPAKHKSKLLSGKWNRCRWS